MKKSNFKVLIFYAALILVVFLAISMLFKQTDEQKITYGNIVEYFQEDTVKSFVLDEEYYLQMTVYLTDENGEIPDMPLTPGDYTFREILAPEGYELNEAEMPFTVHEDGTVTGDTTIRDDFTRVQLIKHDENGRPLADTQFILSDESGRISGRCGIVSLCFTGKFYGKMPHSASGKN